MEPSGGIPVIVIGASSNSAAVVIGAMLIAPLMGPIYGIALGLLREDRRLFFAALLSEAIGIVLAVLALSIGTAPMPATRAPKRHGFWNWRRSNVTERA